MVQRPFVRGRGGDGGVPSGGCAAAAGSPAPFPGVWRELFSLLKRPFWLSNRILPLSRMALM